MQSDVSLDAAFDHRLGTGSSFRTRPDCRLTFTGTIAPRPGQRTHAINMARGLDELPAEILDRIVTELVADSYANDRLSYGPSLRNFSLTCRRISAIVRPLRFYDWELVTEGPIERLEQHLRIPSFALGVRILAVPLLDPRSNESIAKVDTATYDAMLSRVVGSARSVRKLTFAFENPSIWPETLKGRPMLRRTLEACLAHTQVSEIDFIGITNIRAAQEASKIVASHTILRSLTLTEGTSGVDDNEDFFCINEVIQMLWSSLSSSASNIEFLTINVPLLRVITKTSLPALSIVHSIKTLNLINLSYWTHNGSGHPQMLAALPNLEELSISLDDLCLAIQHSDLTLKLSNLKTLKLRIRNTSSMFSSQTKYRNQARLLVLESGMFKEPGRLESLWAKGFGCVPFLVAIIDLLPLPHPPTAPLSPLKRVAYTRRTNHPDGEIGEPLSLLRRLCKERGIDVRQVSSTFTSYVE